MNLHKYSLVLLLIAILLTTGCELNGQTNPSILSVNAEPSFVEAGENVRIGYEIFNPLTISFIGTTELQYDTACISGTQSVKNIDVPPGETKPYFTDLRIRSSSNIECVGGTIIQVVLKENAGNILEASSVRVNIAE